MKITGIAISLSFLFYTTYFEADNINKEKMSIVTQNDKDRLNFTSGYSDVNGLTMYYEIHGSDSDLLVLIHGGGSTIGTTFGKILPLLAEKHKILAVELQAHGHTSDRNSPESFEQDADDVVQLLRNLHISKATFFGFSNGGNTAIQIAVRHPEFVDRLILASTFYKRDAFHPGFFEGMEKATIKDMPQFLKTAFLEINPDSSKLLVMFNKDRERMLQFKDWPDETLRSIKAPALIISGDRDAMVTGHVVAMSNLIVNSRLMILPATHGSYMGVAESPDSESKMTRITADIIEDFLRE